MMNPQDQDHVVEDDYEMDILTLSRAFMSAQDEDVINTSNIVSRGGDSNNGAGSLHFYVVPRHWFQNAWPYLNYARPSNNNHPNNNNNNVQHNASWKTGLGSMENEPLLKPLSYADVGKTNAPRQLLPNKRYIRDYVLVGPSVWLLLKQKFGVDKEVALSCVPKRQNGATTIVVGDQSIPILHTGRFPYEALLLQQDETEDGRDLVETNKKSSSNHWIRDDDEIDDNDDDDKEMEDVNLMYASNQPVLTLTSKSNGYNNHDAADDKKIVILRRRLGSGLGNLGNTCFMNSTLQCLCHTQPLQKYFLTGDYRKDLNKNNPLGTGGELATQFAQLLGEMWGKQVLQNSLANAKYHNDALTNVVYPRAFKVTLGKHAEQFIGHHQHDSQEFATYLLDALHEDCNRVTRKPYIEKPEQGENESDQEASNKAWALHLQRDDSRVLENFMGQVKSRVQCNKKDCGRVSTTFDPFMFLSVPIPGSEERTIELTYVPLDPNVRNTKLYVKVSKVATIETLKKCLQESIANVLSTEPPEVEDLVVLEVWNNSVYEYHTDDEVDCIKDNDTTFAYQLQPLEVVKKHEASLVAAAASSNYFDETTEVGRELAELQRPKRYKLKVEEMTRLNSTDAWKDALKEYLETPIGLEHAVNPRRKNLERVRFLRRLVTFLDDCHSALENEDTTGQKRTRDDVHDDVEMNGNTISPSFKNDTQLDQSPAITEVSDNSSLFSHVYCKNDLAILEFCSRKFLQEIKQLDQDRKELPHGLDIEVCFRKDSPVFNKDRFTIPLVLRITSDTTVYQLREILAVRLARSLKGMPAATMASTGESTSERGDTRSCRMDTDDGFGSPESWIMRQVSMSYLSRGVTPTPVRSISGRKQLGSVSNRGSGRYDSNPFAQPDDQREKEPLSKFLKQHDQILLEWTEDLVSESFDTKEFEFEQDSSKEEKAAKKVSVLDCIDKFCQMEQLEETEKWYCSRCKEHVQAWKQFHLYRSPPHLIVHLKRFEFSARTHRRQKISKFVDFPLEGLDLTEHVLHWTEEEKPLYDCYAVSNHYGGLGGGHYTAYALNDGGIWCYYDDSRITENVQPSEVVSDAAYVLYYRRKDVPVGQDFEISIQTDDNLHKPVVIQDTASSIVDAPSAWDTKMVASSTAAMVDDDDGMDDTGTEAGSRCTSPASVNDSGAYQLTADEDDDNQDDDSLPLQ